MKEFWQAFDWIGLILCIVGFFLSVVGMCILWMRGDENYWAMLFPMIMTSWGIWGAGSLILKRMKKKKENEEISHQ